MGPGAVLRLVRDNVVASSTLISLSPKEVESTLERLAARGLSGGVVYDALIARAAEKAHVDQLVTLNLADFKRAWPEGIQRLTTV